MKLGKNLTLSKLNKEKQHNQNEGHWQTGTQLVQHRFCPALYTLTCHKFYTATLAHYARFVFVNAQGFKFEVPEATSVPEKTKKDHGLLLHDLGTHTSAIRYCWNVFRVQSA